MLKAWGTGESGQVSGEGSHDIDKYNRLHDDKVTDVDARNKGYADLVNSYYNLATDFYEWGWGQSFHFAEKVSLARGDRTLMDRDQPDRRASSRHLIPMSTFLRAHVSACSGRPRASTGQSPATSTTCQCGSASSHRTTSLTAAAALAGL